jgi:hypothetical protein
MFSAPRFALLYSDCSTPPAGSTNFDLFRSLARFYLWQAHLPKAGLRDLIRRLARSYLWQAHLPEAERLDGRDPFVQVLLLCPTRALMEGVGEEVGAGMGGGLL